MPLIQLIRHGESIANSGGVSKTPACIPLSKRGEDQALALVAQFLRPPDLIVVSPYIRTHQTAAPLCARFPAVPVETWPVHEFTYLNEVQYANTTEDQRTPGARAYWQRRDPSHCEGAGAESFASFMARVDDLIERLTTRHERHICIFTHSFFINAVQWRCLHPEAEVDAHFIEGYLDFRLANPVANAEAVIYAAPKAHSQSVLV
ncbi:histidine phosphatase family protein [Prosthecobacter dejongeii]|uniref:Broad specificity phosphatase PhoE n=1 Tax=Prosthecobacter dejongeii TaxID=48465 RepID=A0A7W7YKB0_9BACT|nr:histidine phosphatase family protein [Prosthecobacter dejongeii]MBB5037786.1 broad specificity phosphatase PhoE [Prosthecobacter dejongeii]